MELFTNDSREDRNMEDYLFADYDRSAYKSTFALDQQFAKPIEDEDLFGDLQDGFGTKDFPDNCANNVAVNQDDAEENQAGLFSGIGNERSKSPSGPGVIGLFRDSEFENQENEKILSDFSPSKMRSLNIDEIFVDDYSDASDDGGTEKSHRPESNSAPEDNSSHNQTYSRNLTSAPNRQLTEKEKFLKKIKEQVLANGIIPRKIQPDSDGFIEVGDGPYESARTPGTKFMFSKLIHKNNKTSDPLQCGGKVSWCEYKDALLKKIHADKRKIWDSFQAPCDNYDEDEILVEEQSDSPIDDNAIESDNEGTNDNNNEDEEQGSDVDEEDGMEGEDNDLDEEADDIEVEDDIQEQEASDDDRSVDSYDARLISKTGRSKVIIESDDESSGSTSRNQGIEEPVDTSSRECSGEDQAIELDACLGQERGSRVVQLEDGDSSRMDDSDESDFDDEDEDD